MGYAWTAMIGLVIGWIIGLGMMASKIERSLVDHGHGLYCPVSGDFAFNGECR